MKIRINGQERELAGPLTVAGLVEQLGMKADRVAVELNREIAPRAAWASMQLRDGDELEVVHFVGGGTSGHRMIGRSGHLDTYDF